MPKRANGGAHWPRSPRSGYKRLWVVLRRVGVAVNHRAHGCIADLGRLGPTYAPITSSFSGCTSYVLAIAFSRFQNPGGFGRSREEPGGATACRQLNYSALPCATRGVAACEARLISRNIASSQLPGTKMSSSSSSFSVSLFVAVGSQGALWGGFTRRLLIECSPLALWPRSLLAPILFSERVDLVA